MDTPHRHRHGAAANHEDLGEAPPAERHPSPPRKRMRTRSASASTGLDALAQAQVLSQSLTSPEHSSAAAAPAEAFRATAASSSSSFTQQPPQAAGAGAAGATVVGVVVPGTSRAKKSGHPRLTAINASTTSAFASGGVLGGESDDDINNNNSITNSNSNSNLDDNNNNNNNNNDDDNGEGIDPIGETRVTRDGELLGDRRFRVNSFVLPNRHPTRRFMFAPDVAKCIGLRDGFTLFHKHPTLTRLVTTDAEREQLAALGLLSSHLRSRKITLIGARTVFRKFGHSVVRDGLPVRDDYWVSHLKDPYNPPAQAPPYHMRNARQQGTNLNLTLSAHPSHLHHDANLLSNSAAASTSLLGSNVAGTRGNCAHHSIYGSNPSLASSFSSISSAATATTYSTSLSDSNAKLHSMSTSNLSSAFRNDIMNSSMQSLASDHQGTCDVVGAQQFFRIPKSASFDTLPRRHLSSSASNTPISATATTTTTPCAFLPEASSTDSSSNAIASPVIIPTATAIPTLAAIGSSNCTSVSSHGDNSLFPNTIPDSILKHNSSKKISSCFTEADVERWLDSLHENANSGGIRSMASSAPPKPLADYARSLGTPDPGAGPAQSEWMYLAALSCREFNARLREDRRSMLPHHYEPHTGLLFVPQHTQPSAFHVDLLLDQSEKAKAAATGLKVELEGCADILAGTLSTCPSWRRVTTQEIDQAGERYIALAPGQRADHVALDTSSFTPSKNVLPKDEDDKGFETTLASAETGRYLQDRPATDDKESRLCDIPGYVPWDKSMPQLHAKTDVKPPGSRSQQYFHKGQKQGSHDEMVYTNSAHHQHFSHLAAEQRHDFEMQYVSPVVSPNTAPASSPAPGRNFVYCMGTSVTGEKCRRIVGNSGDYCRYHRAGETNPNAPIN